MGLPRGSWSPCKCHQAALLRLDLASSAQRIHDNDGVLCSIATYSSIESPHRAGGAPRLAGAETDLWHAPPTMTFLWSFVAIVVADQVTKHVITKSLIAGQYRHVLGSVGLRLVINRRAGLLRLSTVAAALVWLIAVAGLLVLSVTGFSFSRTGAMALGLVVGGATGNLIDRLTRGGVIDFVVAGWWPVFNLADAAMVAGTGAVLWSVL